MRTKQKCLSNTTIIPNIFHMFVYMFICECLCMHTYILDDNKQNAICHRNYRISKKGKCILLFWLFMCNKKRKIIFSYYTAVHSISIQLFCQLRGSSLKWSLHLKLSDLMRYNAENSSCFIGVSSKHVW